MRWDVSPHQAYYPCARAYIAYSNIIIYLEWPSLFTSNVSSRDTWGLKWVMTNQRHRYSHRWPSHVQTDSSFCLGLRVTILSKYNSPHAIMINCKLSSATWWPFCFSLHSMIMTCAEWWPYLFRPQWEFNQDTKLSQLSFSLKVNLIKIQ